MAQFSRFVRPGHYRIGVTHDTNAAVSAYRNPAGSEFAIVAINTNSSTSVNQTFVLTNFTASSVTPWITSSSQSLAAQSALAVSNATFTYTLPPSSMVTFVGQAGSNTPPTLAAVPNQTINAGFALVVTNTATDTNQPAQTLTFSLLGAPTNATLTPLNNNANAIFAWRPLVSQANTTNTITMKVADNGSPNLSATNSFLVTVNPLAQPVFSSISLLGNGVSLAISGDAGPDYMLLTSTNLTDWRVLLITNPPTLPFSVTDTNVNDTLRFYRLQLGP